MFKGLAHESVLVKATAKFAKRGEVLVALRSANPEEVAELRSGGVSQGRRQTQPERKTLLRSPGRKSPRGKVVRNVPLISETHAYPYSPSYCLRIIDDPEKGVKEAPEWKEETLAGAINSR